MNISVYRDTFSVYFAKQRKKEGHTTLINQFSPDTDLLITDGIQKMYTIYRNLKTIKKKDKIDQYNIRNLQ